MTTLPPTVTLEAWYNAGFRALVRHARTQFGLDPRGGEKLDAAAAHCRARYIEALIEHHGKDVAAQIISQEKV